MVARTVEDYRSHLEDKAYETLDLVHLAFGLYGRSRMAKWGRKRCSNIGGQVLVRIRSAEPTVCKPKCRPVKRRPELHISSLKAPREQLQPAGPPRHFVSMQIVDIGREANKWGAIFFGVDEEASGE